jgi:hypothetical protein
MNPAPDADRRSVGDDNFAWIVDAVADLVVHRALAPPRPMPLIAEQWLRTPAEQ